MERTVGESETEEHISRAFYREALSLALEAVQARGATNDLKKNPPKQSDPSRDQPRLRRTRRPDRK